MHCTFVAAQINLYWHAAIEIDPNNWKGYWRKGVALMSMAKRQFRTKQAIEAFEACATCNTLPSTKKNEVHAEILKAKARLEQQEAEVIFLQ